MSEKLRPAGGSTSSKRALMLERALDAFVVNGYVGTSTDQLAAAAAVSKQTLYKEFGDKEGVFTALIHAESDRIHDPFAPLTSRMSALPTADEAVRLLAEQFAGSIMSPRVQQLRRLVIAEATRFPELGRIYWERGFQRVLTSIGGCLDILDQRRLLAIPDTVLAANHFAGMLLWIPSNQVMFTPADRPISKKALAAIIDAGAAAFLRAYAPSPA